MEAVKQQQETALTQMIQTMITSAVKSTEDTILSQLEHGLAG